MRKWIVFVMTLVALLLVCSVALADFCPWCGFGPLVGPYCSKCGSYVGGTSSGGSGGNSVTHNGNPWPVVTLPMTQVYFHPSGDNRVQSYCGPGDFPGAGAYKTMKMRSTYALFTDGNYTLIDMDYMTVGHRRLYFRKSAYPKDRYTIPAFDYTAYPAVTTASVTPMWGPGSDYDQFGDAQISSGTYLDVFFEEDGYVFAEFQCKLGRVRAWINVNQVRAQ